MPIKYILKSAEFMGLDFFVNKNVLNGDITTLIKKAGGRMLNQIEVFDVYTGENVKENEKSIAYTLTFKDDTKTLSDEEVMQVFNKIITEVSDKCHAKLKSI